MSSDLPKIITARRKMVFRASTLSEPESDYAMHRFVERPDRAGIAFSGGGIRSATISLGVTEALAAYDRFYAFDMMSTVSGGGYFGGFLRSLYVEREAGKGKKENEDVIIDRAKLADKVLRSLPDQQYFRGEEGRSDDVIESGFTVKSPLWWLRENGRYLAPNGMSDYAFALVFIVRNWMAMFFAFMVPLMLAFGAIQLAMVAISCMADGLGMVLTAGAFKAPALAPLVSPAIFLLPLLLAVMLGVGATYWISVRISEEQKSSVDTRLRFLWHWAVVGLFMIVVVMALRRFLPADEIAPQSWWIIFAFVGTLLLASCRPIIGIVWPMNSWSILRNYRRIQTRMLVYICYAWLIVAVFAAIDTAAIALRDFSNDDAAFTFALPASMTAILAWLAAKVPQWLDAKNGGISRALKSYGNQAAMLASVVMLGGAALVADMLMLKLVWTDGSWNEAPNFNWWAIGSGMGVLALLFLAISRSPQFLNITGLGQLYASRLSRSYLGATNYSRLQTRDKSDVTQSKLGDDMSLRHYMRAQVLAPLHLINVTLNRTIGTHDIDAKVSAKDDPLIAGGVKEHGRLPSYESSIVLRDRQGDRLVFGPHGMRTGGHFWSWRDMDLANAERLTLGTICAISGAAVNSGMGRYTSIGRSILLTLANLRLGYWWKSPLPEKGVWNWLTGTYDYFFSEMLARFKRQKGYWHLSDGGHSENTGALSLLERGCSFMLVCDNGEDPDYLFADLETFARTARTDVGVEIDIVSGDEFPLYLNLNKQHFFNGGAGDWRGKAKQKDSDGFALLLSARYIPPTDANKNERANEAKPEPGWIIWLKPSLFKGLPTDIATYAELHPDFPQQPTSNQFFDEAQWESYRRLGFHMGRTLFNSAKTLDRLVPKIRLKT